MTISLWKDFETGRNLLPKFEFIKGVKSTLFDTLSRLIDFDVSEKKRSRTRGTWKMVISVHIFFPTILLSQTDMNNARCTNNDFPVQCWQSKGKWLQSQDTYWQHMSQHLWKEKMKSGQLFLDRCKLVIWSFRILLCPSDKHLELSSGYHWTQQYHLNIPLYKKPLLLDGPMKRCSFTCEAMY